MLLKPAHSDLKRSQPEAGSASRRTFAHPNRFAPVAEELDALQGVHRRQAGKEEAAQPAAAIKIVGLHLARRVIAKIQPNLPHSSSMVENSFVRLGTPVCNQSQL